MEFFSWTPQTLTASYRTALVVSQEDPIPLWIPDTAQCTEWQWDEACSTTYIGHPAPLPFESSGFDSPTSESFHGSSYADSNIEASPQEHSIIDFELPLVEAGRAGRPRASVSSSSSRDINENRKQRRRTQNRNSQRVYRQRRLEERNTFEVRATIAEEASAKLKSQVDELESEVAILTEQVRGLEVENAVLRRDSQPTTRNSSPQQK